MAQEERKLFKGGKYMRADTIKGNTVFSFGDFGTFPIAIREGSAINSGALCH